LDVVGAARDDGDASSDGSVVDGLAGQSGVAEILNTGDSEVSVRNGAAALEGHVGGRVERGSDGIHDVDVLENGPAAKVVAALFSTNTERGESSPERTSVSAASAKEGGGHSGTVVDGLVGTKAIVVIVIKLITIQNKDVVITIIASAPRVETADVVARDAAVDFPGVTSDGKVVLEISSRGAGSSVLFEHLGVEALVRDIRRADNEPILVVHLTTSLD